MLGESGEVALGSSLARGCARAASLPSRSFQSEPQLASSLKPQLLASGEIGDEALGSAPAGARPGAATTPSRSFNLVSLLASSPAPRVGRSIQTARPKRHEDSGSLAGSLGRRKSQMRFLRCDCGMWKEPEYCICGSGYVEDDPSHNPVSQLASSSVPQQLAMGELASSLVPRQPVLDEVGDMDLWPALPSGRPKVASPASCPAIQSLPRLASGKANLDDAQIFMTNEGLEVCLQPVYLHALNNLADELGSGQLSAFVCYNRLVDLCPTGQLGLDLDSLEFFLDVLVDGVDIPRYGAYTLLFAADCKGLISGLDFVRVLSYFQDPRR